MPRAAAQHTYVVDSAGDASSGTSCAPGHAKGTCTLRAAVNAADADTGPDTITIPSGMHVTLSQGSSLPLSNSMFIDGTGASVNGGGHQIFSQSGQSTAVEITGLRLTGAVNPNNDGGAIYCGAGSLVLTNVVVTGNSAGYGGGIYNYYDCALWVGGSTFTANVATGSVATSRPLAGAAVAANGEGGAIYAYGPFYVARSTFGGPKAADANVAYEGAGIYNYDSTSVLLDSTVMGNRTTRYGYGVGVYNDEFLKIAGCLIEGNGSSFGAEGAGLYNEYNIQVLDTKLIGNFVTGTSTSYGAGLYDAGDTSSYENVDLIGNTARVGGGADVYGGGAYVDGSQFSWTGGEVVGSRNGTSGQSDYVEGGAIYTDASNATFSGLLVSDTVNQSGPGEGVEGGALYDESDSYERLQSVTIAGTSSSGEYVYGGAIYNYGYADLSGISVSGTTNHASYASGGYIYGGVIYNDDYITMEGFTADGTTNRADLGSAKTPSTTSSYIYGGDVYNDDEAVGDRLSFNGTTSVASGGNSYVYGGAWYNDDYAILTRTQLVNTTVRADDYVYGGLVYTDEDLVATDFTVGRATVTVAGGPDASGPYADGAILYNDNSANYNNATFDDVVSSVPTKSTGYDWAFENASYRVMFTNTTIANDTTTGPSRTDGTSLLYADGASSMTFRNSIVAGTPSNLNCAQGVGAGGLIKSAGYNLDSGHSCKFAAKGDQSGVNPKVNPLADNGGDILTAALTPNFYGPFRAGSPAINAGNNATCSTTDARGLPRPQGGPCDLGAYEVPAQGYNMTGPTGGLFHFGAGHFLGSVAGMLAKHEIGPLQGPITAVVPTPNFGGYWQLGGDGGVFTFGTAVFRGTIARLPLADGIVGGAATPDDGGYWLVGADGHVYPFGDAIYYGSEAWKIRHERVVGIAATRDGGGYWLVTANGNVINFGDAANLGSPFASGVTLKAPLVGMATTIDGRGYWLVGSDGGVFAYGDAKYYGSTGALHLNKPIVSIAATPDSFGYWLVAGDGGVFNFGDAQYLGSLPGLHVSTVVDGAASANGL
jgi:hypothetical protein